MTTHNDKLLLTSIKYVGIRELPRGYNPQIRIWIEASCESLGLTKPADDSHFAWCACWLSNMLIESEAWELTARHIVRARDFLTVGQVVRDPIPGDIVVLSRGVGKGHVGIYLNKVENKIHILSGNTSDSVSVYPFDDSRLLGYRRV